MAITRLTPPSQPPYASLDVLKSQLGITGSDQDAALTSVLVQASALVDSYCGRALACADYSETIRLRAWDAPRALILSRRPVVAVTGLMIGDADMLDDDAIDLDLDADAGLLYPPLGSVTWGPCACDHRITVIYRAGYIVADGQQDDGAVIPATLPPEITFATLSAARALYHAPGRGDPMIRSESAQGVGSVSYLDPDAVTGGLPPDAAAALARFRRAGIA